MAVRQLIAGALANFCTRWLEARPLLDRLLVQQLACTSIVSQLVAGALVRIRSVSWLGAGALAGMSLEHWLTVTDVCS